LHRKSHVRFFFTGHLLMCQLVSKKKRHVRFDWVKIKGDYGFAKWVKLKGPKVIFLNLGDQNRKFVKLGVHKAIMYNNHVRD